jgi:hypothetical protein
MNSRIACSYVRCEQAEIRLFSTAVFDCSKSGSFRTDFGDRLRFAERDFAIVAALQRRNDSILSKPLSLDGSPFTDTYNPIGA